MGTIRLQADVRPPEIACCGSDVVTGPHPMPHGNFVRCGSNASPDAYATFRKSSGSGRQGCRTLSRIEGRPAMAVRVRQASSPQQRGQSAPLCPGYRARQTSIFLAMAMASSISAADGPETQGRSAAFRQGCSNWAWLATCALIFGPAPPIPTTRAKWLRKSSHSRQTSFWRPLL